MFNNASYAVLPAVPEITVDTIQRDFEKFNLANPTVLQTLRKLTNITRASGKKHYSMKTIYEVCRHHHNLKTTSDDGFKLNNNYTSRYARLLIQEDTTLKEFFKTRKLTAN